MKSSLAKRIQGISAALASAFFLGLAPVFGKQAINLGLPPVGVVAMRTSLAAILLLLVILLFKRQFLFIYPAGLLGCFLAGGINGLGSLLYYGALGRIDAGLGQLLYSLYPIFLVGWLWLDRQPPNRLTILRLLLILPALCLLSQGGASTQVDFIGVVMMLGASILYALHLPINQRVLYDMPAPTVTLYTLLAMSAVVVPAFLFSGAKLLPGIRASWLPVLGLTMVTFFSRLMLFIGVKHLGGLQTALLGLSELLITLLFSQLWLGERLAAGQWCGVTLLIASLMLVGLEKKTPTKYSRGRWLSWLRPPGLPTDFPWPPND